MSRMIIFGGISLPTALLCRRDTAIFHLFQACELLGSILPESVGLYRSEVDYLDRSVHGGKSVAYQS